MAHCGLFFALSSGIRVRSCDTNWNKLKVISYVVPSLPEQQRIAEFLDAKCAEIDSILEKTQASIVDYKALKQSVITEAVTKGIRGERPMKATGIPWIGVIPKEWAILPIKVVFENLDYLREPISAEERERNNPQYDYYGASGVIDRIDFYNVDDTVLLIGEDGANLLLRHLPLVYRASGKFWVNNHAHILKPRKGDYGYLAYMLEAIDYTLYITGTAQPKLSQDNLNTVKLCVPPYDEQKEIAAYLDEKCAAIDSLIAAKEALISELETYKKSLIYEYVTGKKEVI